MNLHHFILKTVSNWTKPELMPATYYYINLDYFVYLSKVALFSCMGGKRLICTMMLVLVKLGLGPKFVQDIFKVDI